jgi:nitrite reductase/ring-hydroxylating ferredoxin subunit
MPDSQVERFIRPEQLEKELRALHAGMVVTTDRYVSDVPGYLADLEWNFFDEVHRIHVHGTYNDMFKVFAGKTFSVNTVRLGRLPILVQVANAKIASGVFYQSMTVLGILYCHQVVSMSQVGEGKIRLDRRWLTASHWLFRPLHGPFNRMLMQLQDKQDREDNAIVRERRFQLRQAGFRFQTDDPDFINSNQLFDHVAFPQGDAEARLEFSTLLPKVGSEVRVSVGALELMLKREERGLRVWPGICPHEGAALETRHRCDGIVRCPWHGRQFRGAELAFGSDDKWRFLEFLVGVEGEEVVVRRT